MSKLSLVTYLTDTVRQIESIPTATQTFTDAQLVQLMNIELLNGLVPLLVKLQEEYFVTTVDVIVDQSTLSIPIPSDAIGMKLREVCWVGTNGQFLRIPKMSLEQVSTYIQNVRGYYIQQNSIKFLQNSLQPGTIRLFYLRRPAQMVTEAEAGQIVSINTGTNYITLSSIPSTGLAIGDLISVMSNVQPNGYVVENVEVLDILGLSVQLDPSVVAQISVDEWITLPGEAPFAQYIPQEALFPLCQGTAVRCCEALGDRESYTTAKAVYDKMCTDLETMLASRVQSDGKKMGGANGGLRNYTNMNGWGRGFTS